MNEKINFVNKQLHARVNLHPDKIKLLEKNFYNTLNMTQEEIRQLYQKLKKKKY